LLRLTGDTVAAFDESHQRFTFFSPHGDYVRDVRPSRPFTNPSPVGAFSDGVLVLSDLRIDTPESGFFKAPVVLTSYGKDGTFIDSLGSVPSVEIGVIEKGRIGMAARIFAPRTSIALRGDRFWVGKAEEPSIEVRDRRGRLVQIIRWTSGSRAVGPNDAEAWFRKAHPNATAERRRRFGITPVTKDYPAYSRIVVDSAENLWVQPYPRPTATDVEPWLVFDRTGAMVARVALPSAFVVTEAGANWVLGVQPGDMGEERVVVYSLER
jgi:hypothetical protein